MRLAVLLIAVAACGAKAEKPATSSTPANTAAFWCRPDDPGVNECWRNVDVCKAAPTASGSPCVAADGAWCRSDLSAVDDAPDIETCTISESDCREADLGGGREQPTTVQDCTWTQ
jgi:hypothetical protein